MVAATGVEYRIRTSKNAATHGTLRRLLALGRHRPLISASRLRSDLRIAIAGGGVGGLSLAIALGQAGFSPLVLERATALLPIGGALLLRASATSLLSRWGVLDDLLPLSAIVHRALVRDSRGRLIRSWKLPGSGHPAIFVRRSILQDLLVAHAKKWNAELRLGVAATNVAPTAGGMSSIACAGGISISADLVVGCDGIRSSLRDSISGRISRPLKFRRYVQWRHIGPCEGAVEKEEWWGDGLRFGVAPVGPSMRQWYVSATTDDPNFGNPAGSGDTIGMFNDWFKNWDPRVRALVEGARSADLTWNSIYDRQFDRSWGSGNRTLLGDAAHALTPDLGLGACLAIEDAAELAAALAEGGSIDGALRRYERQRMDVAARVVRRSRLTGWMAQWTSPSVCATRRLMLRYTPEFIWRRQMQATYGS